MKFIYDPNYHFLLIQILFNFLIGGVILAGIIQKLISLKNSENLHPLLSLLVGIGLSPYLIAILLNYLLWIIPHQSDSFYFIAVIIVFVLLAFVGRKEIRALLASIMSMLRNLHKGLIVMGFFGLIIFMIGWSYYLTTKSLTEHDTLEYAVQGKVFYDTKEVSYDAHNYDEESGFYYVGLHGYSFPLIASWERICNGMLGYRSDLFFRSVNSLYGIWILLSIVLIAYKAAGRHLALILLIALPFTYGYYETIFKYHIDLYRIFFLNFSLLGMYFLIKKPSWGLAVVLALIMGAQANAHSLGALLYILELGVIFFFLPLQWIPRLRYFAAILILSLLFGSLHYLVDVIWGTGWILQEIKFY